jgi:aminoglycoside phosphotransferase (APT) family kinase protein
MNNTALIASGSAHGMDIAGLSSFLAMHLPGDWQALNLEQFVGGQSNPTYRLRAGKTDYVLRKKPAGALAPSAHAIDREFRVMLMMRPCWAHLSTSCLLWKARYSKILPCPA